MFDDTSRLEEAGQYLCSILFKEFGVQASGQIVDRPNMSPLLVFSPKKGTSAMRLSEKLSEICDRVDCHPPLSEAVTRVPMSDGENPEKGSHVAINLSPPRVMHLASKL